MRVNDLEEALYGFCMQRGYPTPSLSDIRGVTQYLRHRKTKQFRRAHEREDADVRVWVIKEWLEEHQPESICVNEVIDYIFNTPRNSDGDHDPSLKNFVGRVMSGLGWVNKQFRVGRYQREWRYVPPPVSDSSQPNSEKGGKK